MAQINLLKQKSVSQNAWETLPRVLVKVFFAIAICVLAYYGWTWIRIGKINKEIKNLSEQNAQNINTAMNLGKRNEVLARQAQLKELDGILSRHYYWSQFLPELAKVTLKTAAYSTLKADIQGGLSLSVTVNSLNDLDKYLQVFDQAKFNENFSDVRIGGFHKNIDSSGTTVKFDVRMNYNPSLLIYKPDSK